MTSALLLNHQQPINLYYILLGSHYNDVIMRLIASQITSLTIVCSIVYSDADQRKHQSSASLAFVRGIQRGPVNSPHKGPATRKMFPFDDVIMESLVLSKTITWINVDSSSIGTPGTRFGEILSIHSSQASMGYSHECTVNNGKLKYMLWSIPGSDQNRKY